MHSCHDDTTNHGPSAWLMEEETSQIQASKAGADGERRDLFANDPARSCYRGLDEVSLSTVKWSSLVRSITNYFIAHFRQDLSPTSRRLGEQDLPTMPGSHDARCVVNIQPDIALGGALRFSGMQPDAYPHCCALGPGVSGKGAECPPRRTPHRWRGQRPRKRHRPGYPPPARATDRKRSAAAVGTLPGEQRSDRPPAAPGASILLYQ